VQDALDLLGKPAGLTVLVNDPQRHTDTPAVLAELLRHIPPANIRLLVATGTHRFGADTRAEFERRLCADVDVAAVAWHDAEAEGLVDVAGVWRGHPWLTESPPLLAIGSVEPHYFAGCTGAHKTLTIGCAAHEDIEANHANALSPACRPCRLEGNPVHEGVARMLSALSAARAADATFKDPKGSLAGTGLEPQNTHKLHPDSVGTPLEGGTPSSPVPGKSVAAVNLVQVGERIVGAFGGDPLDALASAAPVAREHFLCHIDEPADAIVAEAAGALSRSFYQADKAVKNNEWAVRDGGALILVAPCEDGVGQDPFMDLLREAPTYADAVDVVRRRGYRLGDHKAVRLRYLTDPACRNVRLFAVCPGLTDTDARIAGMTRAESVDAALAAAGIDSGTHRVFRVKDAANTCAIPAGIDTAPPSG